MTATSCRTAQEVKTGFTRAALAVYPRNGNTDPFPIDSGMTILPRDFDLIFWPDHVEPLPIYDYNLLTPRAAEEGWTHLVQWQESGQWTGILLADDDYINEPYSFSGDYETPAI